MQDYVGLVKAFHNGEGKLFAARVRHLALRAWQFACMHIPEETEALL